MKILGKYLKPFAAVLAVIIALLFGQAICDLNLPNYMSKIVNVGLTQGGIEDAAPKAISQNGLKLMTQFMSEEERSLVEDNYRLVGKDDSDYSKLVKKYPKLENEDIYVLQKVDKETKEKLSESFSVASWTFVETIKSMAAANGSGDMADQDMTKLDISKVYPMLPMLSQMPTEQLQKIHDDAKATPATMRDSTGAVLVRSFYTELGADTDAIQNNYILHIGLIMLGIALLVVLFAIAVGFLASRLAASVSRNMRKDVFSKVESFSNAEFDQYSTASLITRTTNDITQVQTFLVMGIRMVCYAPIIGIGGIFMALKKSTSMSWIIALAVIVLLGLILIIFSIAMPKFKKMQRLIDKLNLVSRENLSGLMVIRAFGTQEFEKDRFKKANEDLALNNRFVFRVISFMMPIMMLIMNCISLLIVWVGGHQIANSAMQVGDMMAFMQYSMQIIMAFLMISMMFILIPRASVSAQRIGEVLATEPAVKDPAAPKAFEADKRGYVEFKDVGFRYRGADENVLHHISFTAKPGETTAIIGATGSGKSTLINLIPRFYDVTEGEVCVSGVNVKDVSQHALREEIGFVPQKGVLLSGTIESNLRYGAKDASEEQILEAAEVSQSMEFISQKPDGLQSEIAEGGSNVSGGQKQRLSIGRALAKKAPVNIFDDSFSALDFKTDSKLRKALAEHAAGTTTIVVAQRVSTIMHAEQIIVLDEGRIAGIGTHEELLKNCPVYLEIASSQLSKEEM